MLKVHNFHRKRPHILPPLQNSYPSTFRSMDPLQPPDLLLTKHRFGSPIPRPSDHEEFDYVCNENDDNPKIRISEYCQNEREKHHLMKFNLLPDPILGKTNNLQHQIQKDPTKKPGIEWRGVERKNSLYKNLSKKQLEKPDDDLKLQAVSPSENHENTNISGSEFFQIPSRYKLLKPIGEKTLKAES